MLTTPKEAPGFTGHYEDPDTGLTYMQARYYDSSAGRFMSVDPVGAVPGSLGAFNRYAYVQNNPLGYTDPTGMTADPAQARMGEIVHNAPAYYWDGPGFRLWGIGRRYMQAEDVVVGGGGGGGGGGEGDAVAGNQYAHERNKSLRHDFLGKCLAQRYLAKYGADAWYEIRGDRDSTQPVVPGAGSEAMRNAEHYLRNYGMVQSNSYLWGLDLAETVGYHELKFWVNVAGYYGIAKSPWGYDVPTINELKSGIQGANDALFGNSSKSSFGCDGQ